MILAAVFSSMALVLAAVGVYGVLAYAVLQRQREIGARMALGALPKQILGKFLSLGCQLFAIGALIGLVGAWFVGRAMSSLLFGVSSFDPVVVVSTGLALGLVVMVASLLPSLKASRLSPLDALRSD